MRKALNGKSIQNKDNRERMSSAESILHWKSEEVPPGADFVNG